MNNTTDAVLLVAYLLCITYCIYRIIKDFDDEFTIRLDEAALKEQLEQQGLQDAIGISFKFDKRYEFDKLKQLAITISNKSQKYSIYVDWDCCAFTDLDKRSRRVTRMMPGATLDLFQNQVFSTIPPGTSLKETITAEDLLQRKGDRKNDKLAGDSPLNLEVEITKPLVDLSPPKADAAKARYNSFMKGQEDYTFLLGLALRLLGPERSLGGDRVQILCKFIIHKLSWQAGLPWNPKS